MKKKVLVTGASGFIGKYVTEALLEKEYEVIALVHKNYLQPSKRLVILEGDICADSFIAQTVKAVEKCDVLIHLAADLNIQGSDKTILTNCLGTYHLIRLAKEISVECFIYMSSIPVIGAPKHFPITEDHPVWPETLYHITKYTGEQIVLQMAPKNMRAVILRISSPIGVGMNSKNYLSFLLEKCRKNELIELYGTGSRIQNYLDVRDIAAAVLCGFSASDSGTYLLAGKEAITNRELAFLCKRWTGSSSQIIWGKREDPEEKNQWIISTEKAFSSFGFAPKYMLEDTIQWLVQSLEVGE